VGGVSTVSIGQKLREVREELKLTLKQVEDQGKIGASSLSDFENDKRDPSVTQLQQLGDFYRKPIAYFLDESFVESHEAVLWRNKPASPQCELLEAEFHQLARQYHNLETWTKSRPVSSFKNLFVNEFIQSYPEAAKLAERIIREMGLGDYPGIVLYKTLEEVYDVKIFHVDLDGDGTSSACFYDDNYGAVIILNRAHRKWRRNFDLAHELFHLLIWRVRNHSSNQCLEDDQEEKLAQHFAGCLLMPTERVKECIELARNHDGNVAFEKLEDVANLFEVSLDALIWRLKNTYHFDLEQANQMVDESIFVKRPRRKEETSYYPDRYVALANEALRMGDISIGRYLDYLKLMKPARKVAEKVLSAHVPEPLQVPTNNH
jgi:Zn-dependent peptidase ImmA (M78 family)